MEKTLSALALRAAVTATLLMPFSAHAYLSPDQVFGSPADTTTHSAAPEESNAVPSEQVTKRSAEEVVRQQQASAASARSAAYEQNKPVDAPPEDNDVAPSESLGLFDQNVQYEKRQERMEDSNGPTIVINGNGAVYDSNGNVLHSGAPLVTSTGPETVLAGIAIVLAMICTFAYAHIRSRMTAAILA